MSPKGIITPRSENFLISNVRFYNYDFHDNAAAISTCSHCWHDQATDSGARTIRIEGFWRDEATVPRKLIYSYPYTTIFSDIDGTFTDQGANSWATMHRRHLEWPECTYDEATLETYGGIVCTSETQLRRICWSNLKEQQITYGLDAWILQMDDSIIDPLLEADPVEVDEETGDVITSAL